jgi:acyl-CoA reductase-like NAD-dependent aldehyde dehydrogenase
MSIQTFPPTPAGQAAALAVSDPKNIAFDQGHFVVKDGPDYVASPAATQDDLDRAAARAHVKLNALKAMPPAQVQTWVAANVTTLAQAQDAIATLAIAVGILSRSL